MCFSAAWRIFNHTLLIICKAQGLLFSSKGGTEMRIYMQKEKGSRKAGKGKKGGFVSIEKKISSRFAQNILICCIVLGVVTSVLSYISSVSAVTETIDSTSDIAADYVAAALKQYTAIAYETGTLSRLSSPMLTKDEKKAILDQKVKEHKFQGAFLLDKEGTDVISGTDLSDRDYFKEAMKGDTYVSTPAYSEVTKSVSYAVSAPLWEDGDAGTEVVGVVVYLPDGEFLNDIMRSIKVGEGGTAFMLDANGITIADIDSKIVGVEDSVHLGDTNSKLKKYSAICKKMVAGENGTGTYSYGGKTKVVAYSPVEDMNGWSIGVAAVRMEFLGYGEGYVPRASRYVQHHIRGFDVCHLADLLDPTFVGPEARAGVEELVAVCDGGEDAAHPYRGDIRVSGLAGCCVDACHSVQYNPVPL